MIGSAAVVLSFVVEKIFSSLLGKVTGQIYERLTKKTARRAFEKALALAIKRYGTEERVYLTRHLAGKDGVLSDNAVTEELSNILLFARDVDVEAIGKVWKKSCGSIESDWDFAFETQLFLDYVEEELRNSDTFRQVFESKDLSAIAVKTEESLDSLMRIEEELRGLMALLDDRFGELARLFSISKPRIRHRIVDYSAYLEEKSRGFVGRRWVFQRIWGFIEKNHRGYFFISGDPGIGKTALSSQFVKETGCVHHFNIRTQGINSASVFVSNLCAQLIAAYQLPSEDVTPDVLESPGFLDRVLRQVSTVLGGEGRCVIMVDALDEAERVSPFERGNLLPFPVVVPKGIYFVVTMRTDDEQVVRPLVDCEGDDMVIAHNGSRNLADVADFLRAALARPRIKMYCSEQGLDDKDFVELMVERSEGNFMYLRHVLPEIEGGFYSDLHFKSLPAGFKRYYEDHWRRMRGVSEDAWFTYKLPVIVVLAASLQSVSVDFISRVTGVEKSRVLSVVQGWAPFLHEELISDGREMQRRYELYHSSFFEFVKDKEEVQGENVDLSAMELLIAESLEDTFL